jgi:hypothetical protein
MAHVDVNINSEIRQASGCYDTPRVHGNREADEGRSSPLANESHRLDSLAGITTLVV